MGRRKIEIQPITHERNRSVTFLKRKNGLFKKAYELGVLCSVDVAVIIFEERPGHNVKLYQYGSGNVHDVVQRHLRFDGEKDTRGPGDFSGAGGGVKDDDDEEEDEHEASPPAPSRGTKRRSAEANDVRSAKGTGDMSLSEMSYPQHQPSLVHQRSLAIPAQMPMQITSSIPMSSDRLNPPEQHANKKPRIVVPQSHQIQHQQHHQSHSRSSSSSESSAYPYASPFPRPGGATGGHSFTPSPFFGSPQQQQVPSFLSAFERRGFGPPSAAYPPHAHQIMEQQQRQHDIFAFLENNERPGSGGAVGPGLDWPIHANNGGLGPGGGGGLGSARSASSPAMHSPPAHPNTQNPTWLDFLSNNPSGGGSNNTAASESWERGGGRKSGSPVILGAKEDAAGRVSAGVKDE